ncbi:phage terminase large subunit family protein [Eubacteriales bacterium OttesenSCG-928-N14]|nr:phage terminase large subunit family protein [Eubacteriales bacterium OttesenSCG-928-N14]
MSDRKLTMDDINEQLDQARHYFECPHCHEQSELVKDKIAEEGYYYCPLCSEKIVVTEIFTD